MQLAYFYLPIPSSRIIRRPKGLPNTQFMTVPVACLINNISISYAILDCTEDIIFLYRPFLADSSQVHLWNKVHFLRAPNSKAGP